MQLAVSITLPGPGSNSPTVSSIGGDIHNTTAPLTPSSLFAGCPGTVFCCNDAGNKFAFLDSSSNLWLLDLTLSSPAPVQIVTAANLGTTLNRIAMQHDGSVVYATSNSHKILAISLSTGYAVTVVAGSGTAALTDGQGTAAAFLGPFALDISPDGTYLVCDNNRFQPTGVDAEWVLRKIIIAAGATYGAVTTISTNDNVFYGPNIQGANIRIGRSGVVYVIHNVTTICKFVPGVAGHTDLFATPGQVLSCLAIDSASPGEVNAYFSSNLYANSFARLALAAPGAPSIEPLFTLPVDVNDGTEACEMHFRQSISMGSLYVVDSIKTLWKING